MSNWISKRWNSLILKCIVKKLLIVTHIDGENRMEIGLIGVGKVAQDNYIPTLLRHEDVSLTCYSRSPSRTEAVAEKFGIRPAWTLDEVFERQPEVVFVLTHVEQHLDSTQSLLPFKPKRLFLEKPLVAKQGQA